MKYRIIEETEDGKTRYFPQVKDGFLCSWRKITTYKNDWNATKPKFEETWYYSFMDDALDAIETHKEQTEKRRRENLEAKSSRKIHYL